MTEDVVFFLKEVERGASLPWPQPTRRIGVEPSAWFCPGADPRCSSAYSGMWSALRGEDGRVLPNFLHRYARGIDVGRVAFVGFSAAHGFLNALLNNDADRSGVSAALLMDATFGGGKTGYQKALVDAAAGKMLLATATSHTGGDRDWRAHVWEPVLSATGLEPDEIDPFPGILQPPGGTFRLGELAYYLRYVDANGQTNMPHWEMGKLTEPMLATFLVPYWSGDLGGFSWTGPVVGGLLALGGVVAAVTMIRRRP